MTRQAKTPRQRAEEALAVATRQEKRLRARARDLRSQLEEAEREHRAALARRDHLATHPDLQPYPTSTSTGDDA
ncbi:hypothetical protein GON03_19180 [Nocardioides sp. MAH-18]|uniref:Uncharacterized protein n=1 Tax=Nocardioides agri TaxID=2682843 RepID=A0A6L6XVV1_9ACTN|nr:MULTISPECIES: hypothetical protein [unclassified Nocardioides]MBA2952141.1 hypothetical protein [Nocardioides sp. CGMCC 1.13656]MVQ51309.1 hypothetical protein [Nocardioides sp. MAH-18]